MARDTSTHEGPSWDDLAASYQSKSKKLYVLIEPKSATGKRILIRVTRLSNFRSGSMFFVDGVTPDGKTIELYGYGRHMAEQPCTFEVNKTS